jgi:predicted ATP-dependent protease
MVFWRSKSAKKADTPVIVETDVGQAAAADEAADKSQERPPATNVVTLVTGRLADRLADVNADADSPEAKKIKPTAAIKPAEAQHALGQNRAAAKIRAALAAKPGEHLLVLGEPGTGRLDLVKALAAEASREPAADWIYIIQPHAPARARAFALPAGEKAGFISALNQALDKAGAALDRHIKSDEHRVSLDLLEEEMRYRGENAVEQIRRRAEAQNIAVVKSLDGYVLAPMHEGRVVRSEVFRALPEALKRNVEAKITTLEGELQSVVAALPDVQFEACEKYDALIRQTALRAIRPSLEPVKKSYENVAAAEAALDAIEDAFLASAAANAVSRGFTPIAVLGRESSNPVDPTEPHRVVTAIRASASDLLGEIGRDAAGRPTLIPGHLMRAGSGFLIVEAWRLAADPQAWLALSAAIVNNEIAPKSAPGIAIEADPVPLAATVILIADDQSWSKLEAIEPGIARHFSHVAKLATTAPIAELSEGDFAKAAARLAADRGLKPLASSIAPILYKDAVQRGGGRVSLARIALLQLLQEADAIAGTHAASQIRAADLDEALTRRADSNAP